VHVLRRALILSRAMNERQSSILTDIVGCLIHLTQHDLLGARKSLTKHQVGNIGLCHGHTVCSRALRTDRVGEEPR
jgi:hypothetical protein